MKVSMSNYPGEVTRRLYVFDVKANERLRYVISVDTDEGWVDEIVYTDKYGNPVPKDQSTGWKTIRRKGQFEVRDVDTDKRVVKIEWKFLEAE